MMPRLILGACASGLLLMLASAQAQAAASISPTISKAFSPASMGVNNVSRLTFTIANPNTADRLENINFQDSYPAGVVNASPPNITNTCGGDTTTDIFGGAAGGNTIGLQGNNNDLPQNTTCQVGVDVTSATAGAYNNVSGAVSGCTNNGCVVVLTGNTASATLVVARPTLGKSFSPATIATGGVSTLTVTLSNSTEVSFTAATFTDTFPTSPGAMTLANPASSNTCGGVLSDDGGGALNAGDPGIRLTGGTIPANGSCAITVQVTTVTEGAHTNTIAAGALSTSGGSNAAAASASVTALFRPTISKTFSPNPVGVGIVSRLTFTLSNSNTVPAAGAAFTDIFPTSPAAMTVAAPLTTTNTCGGTLADESGGALAAGDAGIRLTGGTIPASGSCTVSVKVTAPELGTYNNTSGAVSSSNAGAGNSANAALSVLLTVPPSVEKSFSTSPIAVNGSSVLTLTITNANNTLTLTELAVSDTYPAGLVNTGAPAPATTCSGATITGGAAGGNSIGITGGSIPANSSCTVTVNVTSATNNSYLNTTGAVSSDNAGSGNTASATLVVHAPPAMAKSFNPALINVNTASVLTLTLTNPNSSVMTGAAFTDSYPAGLVNTAAPNASTTCGGTVTGAAGGTSVALAGGTLPANGSCTVTINVTSATAGSYSNTFPVGALTTTNGIANTAAASATLDVQNIVPPNISKSFSPTTIQNGGSSTLRLILSNPNVTATLTGVAVSDTYPANLVNNTPANPAVTCTAGSTGSFTGGVNGANTIGFTGGSILAGGNCQVTVQVSSTTNATYTNSTGAVTSSNGGTGGTATASMTVQAGLVAPVISKQFNQDELGLNGISTLIFTITNPNGQTLFNVFFNDTYPAGLVNAAAPNVTNSCDNDTTNGAANTTGGAAGGNTIGLPTGNTANDMPASSSCTVTVQVTSATAGVYNNTSGAVTGKDGNGGAAATVTGNTASATITYVRPTLSKSFSSDLLASGGTATLTITLSNGSDVNFTAAAFTDTFPVAPGAMTVATPLTTTNTCGGTLQDNTGGALGAGDPGIQLTGGVIPLHGSCTITVNITAAAAGTYTNTIPAGGLSSSGGGNATAATGTLDVPNRPAISKAFGPSAIVTNTSSTLTITLSNNNVPPASSAAFTDNLPAGVTTTGAPSTSCGGTVSATTSSVSLSGGAIPAGAPGTCTVTVSVTAAAGGSYVNTLPAGGLSTSNGSNAAPASATLNVIPPLTVVKSSTVISDPVNGTANPKRIPGAVIEYAVIVNNTGSAAPADNIIISNSIPANTTYAAGSIVVGGTAEDDNNAGADETDPNGGDFNLTTPGAITIRIPVIVGGGSVNSVFRVTLN